MKLFLSYLKSRRRVMVALLVACAVFAATFKLYHLPLDAVLYPALLCAFFGMIALAVNFRRVRARHRRLLDAIRQAGELETGLPEPESIEEADDRALVDALRRAMNDSADRAAARYRDAIDYYTVWAHQIKTPISSMRLTLRGEDSEVSRALNTDLMRIEQYADMVLAYLRLDSESSDYVFRSCDLDEIVRRAVRRFSTEFIARKIRLEYTPLDTRVVTDEKWLGFVVEQVLSNALKYTREGSVRIYMRAPYVLCIEDTGMGIAASDLPRVFEKGYTGFNGRGGARASGIGLYLCRRVCDKLGASIGAESEAGRGTAMLIDLHRPDVKAE